MHSSLIFLLAEDQHRTFCPCGAVCERPYGLCRKCHARMTWRRRTAETTRRATRRRRRGRQARERTRLVTLAASMIRTSQAGS